MRKGSLRDLTLWLPVFFLFFFLLLQIGIFNMVDSSLIESGHDQGIINDTGYTLMKNSMATIDNMFYVGAYGLILLFIAMHLISASLANKLNFGPQFLVFSIIMIIISVFVSGIFRDALIYFLESVPMLDIASSDLPVGIMWFFESYPLFVLLLDAYVVYGMHG